MKKIKMKSPHKMAEEISVNWSAGLDDDFPEKLTLEIEQAIETYAAKLKIAEDALERILECPRWIDLATVPKAGIDAAPQQVVFNASIGFLTIRQAEEALAKIRDEK